MDQILPIVPAGWGEIAHLKIKLPAPSLLEIHNSLPRGHYARSVILDHLRQAAKRDVSAHWLRALVLDENGDLNFDTTLYRKAVSRGKQETYFASAKEVLDKFQFSLNQLSAYQVEEMNASEILEDGKVRNPLISMPDLSDEVASLQKHTAALSTLANKLADGLPNLSDQTSTKR